MSFRYIELSADEYVNQKLLYYKNADTLIKIFSIVIEHIKERGLILTGGKAIDLILRGSGHKLYHTLDNDYDCYSTENYDDAYQLTQKIIDKFGIDFVHTIQAMHPTTARVRYRYAPVADITYIPKDLFDKIPILLYGGIKVVSPEWQMLDQLIVIAYPYRNTPMENITSRWKKDLARFQMLYAVNPCTTKDNIKFKSNKTNTLLSRKGLINKYISEKRVAIGGLDAVNYWTENVSPDITAAPIILYADEPNTFCKMMKAIDIIHYEPILAKVSRFITCKIEDIPHIIIDNILDKIGCKDGFAALPAVGLYYGTVGFLFDSTLLHIYRFIIRILYEAIVDGTITKYICTTTYGEYNLADYIIRNAEKTCGLIKRQNQQSINYSWYPTKKKYSTVDYSVEIFCESGAPNKWEDYTASELCKDISDLFELQNGVTREVFKEMVK